MRYRRFRRHSFEPTPTGMVAPSSAAPLPLFPVHWFVTLSAPMSPTRRPTTLQRRILPPLRATMVFRKPDSIVDLSRLFHCCCSGGAIAGIIIAVIVLVIIIICAIIFYRKGHSTWATSEDHHEGSQAAFHGLDDESSSDPVQVKGFKTLYVSRCTGVSVISHLQFAAIASQQLSGNLIFERASKFSRYLDSCVSCGVDVGNGHEPPVILARLVRLSYIGHTATTMSNTTG